MESRISMVTLGVADLESSLRFYEGLGWRRANTGDEIVFFQLAGIIFALFPRRELAADARVPEAGSGFRGVTLCHCVKSREEVDTIIADAETAGGHITRPAQNTFWGGYSGLFADPDGHLWEIAWNPAWRIDDQGGMHID